MHFLDKMAHLFFLKMKALRSESVNNKCMNICNIKHKKGLYSLVVRVNTHTNHVFPVETNLKKKHK